MKDLQTTAAGGALMANKGESLRHGYDPKDLIFPRAMLLQFTPPKSVEIPTEDFKPGRIINSVTLEELPKKFVPIAVRTRWIRWNAQETSKPGYDAAFEPGAKIWESEDPTDPRVVKEGAWGPNGEPPLATKVLEFFCLFEGVDMPVILSFMKTSFDAGKRLLTLAQLGSEMFSFQYELGSKEDVNNQKQKFFVMTVKQAGRNDGERFEQCQATFDFYARRASEIKAHGEEEVAAPGSEGRPF